MRKLISFDWAIKRLLRSKANFVILEGFLSELLKEDITILEILESESNQEDERDKFNRVDLKVKNEKGEIFIIEVQHEHEIDYLLRILYATSKTISEHMEASKQYQDVVKVISINILYFNLGLGKDYIYHGYTHFEGLHKKDTLELTPRQKKLFGKDAVYQIYPEYYLLKVNQFDDIAKDTLDEWIYFLKHEDIGENFKAKGLKRAKELLDVMKLSEEERRLYDAYLENRRYQASMYSSSFEEGHYEGRKQEKITMAKRMKQNKEPLDNIIQYTGLTREEIEAL